MEVVKQENVKVPNAVLVSGLTNSSADKEVFHFLKQFGEVGRILELPSKTEVIVEYQHEATVQQLQNQLPLDRSCSADPEVVHRIQNLASVYTTEVSASTTADYLTGLKDLAKLSNRPFEDILREELAKMGALVGGKPSEPTPTSTDNHHAVSPASFTTENVHSVSATAASAGSGTDIHNRDGKTHVSDLPADHLSTPEVQRVIVEHIVKTSEMASHSHLSYKLKSFSGRMPLPSFESDYDAWRSSVELCLDDPTISDAQVVRKIMESLSPPASNMVKSLGLQATPSDYLTLLDSAYAPVESGADLYRRFLNTRQNAGEKPSDYLQRLHTALSLAIRRKGMTPDEADRELLTQFCDGCVDYQLLHNLQLEQRKADPPSFPDILFLLRSEERKLASKAERMKQHLAITKTRAFSHSQTTSVPGIDSTCPGDAPTDATTDLIKQVADLTAQVAQLQACRPDKSKKKASKENREQKRSEPETKESKKITASVPRPRPWYCFRCGEDAHIATSCSNDPNPTLVEEKKKALREKQRAWDARNNNPSPPNLN